MSQSQNRSVEPKNHRRRNKVYIMPIVAISIESLVFRSPCDRCIFDERTLNSNISKNNQQMALYHENAIKSVLCNVHAIFIYIFGDKDKDKCFLRSNLPDKLVVFLSSRVVTTGVITDVNRYIESTTIRDNTSTRNILSCNATVSSGMGMNLQTASICIFISTAMSNTMDKLFADLSQQTMIQKAHGVKKAKHSIKDTTNYTRLISFGCTQNKIIKTTLIKTESGNSSSVSYPEDRSSIALCKCFKTYFVEGRRMTYKTSTCKFNSFSAENLKKLVELLFICGMIFNKTKSNMLFLFRRYWHVRNVTQGYMLTILLRRCNIISLNVMRRSYFVIIKSETYPTTTVEFNFTLSNGTAMVFNTRGFENCTSDFTQWNYEHKRILDKSIICSFCVCKPRDKRDANINMQTDADTNECKINSSYYESSSTLKIDPSDDNGNDTKNTIFHAESELFDIKSESGSEIHENGSVIALSINEVASEKSVFTLRKACGNTNFRPRTLEVQTKIHDTITKLTKTCFLKLFDKSQAIKAFFGIPHLNCDRLFNETIFDGLVLIEFIEAMTRCWVQVKLQTYCSVLYLLRTACSTHI